ncbi:MAG: ribonuclease D, partial [Gammaproteobacteria bacterium]
MSATARKFDYLSDTASLEQWVTANAGAASFALDTEFERQRTYFADLCLMQVAAGDAIALVDPLAGCAVQALGTLLAEAPGTKIMHAARQDLEVLHFSGLALPTPLFDTQIAAALAGYADQIGYAELAEAELGVSIDKSQTRTNWRRRPLTDAQCDYAADDVRYLDEIADRLRARLASLDRLAWLEEDCAALLDTGLVDPPAAHAWVRVKGLGGLDETAFARGAALAAWRERTARERNLPRSWIVKDNELVALAVRPPADRRELAALLADSPGAVRRYGDALLDLLAAPPAPVSGPPRPPQLGPAAR